MTPLKRFLPAVALLVALGVCRCDAQSLLTIPRLDPAPIIDGALAPQEWSHAVAVGLFQQALTLKPTRIRQQAWLGYDRERLYVAFRTWGEDPRHLVAEAQGKDGAVWGDDSFELHLAPGEDALQTQFAGNSAGVWYDARGGDKSWDAQWDYRAQTTEDGWQAELAVPWVQLGIPPPEVGQAWRVNVCHNDADRTRPTQNSAWTPVRTNFHDAEGYASAVFAQDVVVGGAVNVTLEEGLSAVLVRIASSCKVAAALSCELAVGDTPGSAQAITVQPGTTQMVRLPTPGPVTESTRGTLRVSDEAGVDMLSQEFPLSARRRASVTFRNLLAIGKAQFEVAAPLGTQGTMAYRFADAGGQVALEGSATVADGRGAASVDVTALPPGDYRVAVDVSVPEQDIADTFQWNATRPPAPEWTDTDAGLTDQVLAPFTPLEVRGDKLLSWGRSYEFAAAWLPTQVMSAHEDLLSSPMRLVAMVNGRAVDLSRLPMRVTRQVANRVETEARGIVGGLSVHATAWMEEDGFWWVTVDVAPAGTDAIDGLTLEMPVRRSIATYIHPSDSTWSTHSGVLPEEGWKSHFWPVVSLVNDDKGLAWYCESMQDWRPADREAAMRVDVTERAATLWCDLLGQPTAIGEGLRYSFGVQACPVKPIPGDWRSRRIVHGARYGMEDRTAYSLGSLAYPAAGNIDFHQGTLEAWVKPQFDPAIKLETQEGRGIHNNSFLQVGPPDDYYASLYWNIDDRGWRYVCYRQPTHEMVVSPSPKGVPWDNRDWRHVAITWGDAIRVYDNGKLVIEQPAEGLWNGRYPDPESLQIRFGSLASGVSRFSVREVRISKRALSVEEMLLTQDAPRASEDNLLHDSLVGLSAQDKATPAGGQVLDGAAVSTVEGAQGVRLFTENAQSQLDRLAAIGCRTLVYHQRWTRDYGKPYTRTNARRLDKLVKGCHDAGIKLLLYVGYGLGDLAPETGVYHDIWTSQPIIRWTSRDGNERQAFSRTCTGSKLWTDYMLHNLRRSLREHDFDGFYYDGTIGFRSCMNDVHGCTYVDHEGKRRPTYPILATREYAKRLYAICKEHRATGLIDCHTSANVLPMRAAWVDQLWNGEQFENHKPGFHFPMDYFRSQCVGTQYGAPSMFLVYPGRPFEEAEALSFTLLHDVLPRSRSERIVRLWQIQYEFDVAGARWLPYWRSGEYVQVTSDPPAKVWDEAGLASLYLHHGEQALLIVSNIQDKPAKVTARVYLERLGLGPDVRARDAERQEPIAITEGVIELDLEGYDYRVIWLQ